MEFYKFEVSNIKAEMARKNITITEMAKKIGISTNSLSSKLNKKTDFKVKEVEKISKVLNVSLNIFFNS